MDKARDDYEEERRVPDREDNDWVEDDDDYYPESEDPDSESSVTPDELQNLFLMLRSGASFRSDPYFNNPFDLEILLGSNGDGYFGVFLFAGFKKLEVQSEEELYESIKPNPFILHCGVEMRYYPFEKWTYFSPYITGRISGFSLFWMYKNALVAGPDTISSDYLGGLGLDGGVGVDFIQNENFQAGFLMLPQVFLFGEETSKGFSNDVFLSYGNIRWSLEAGFKL
ncbi:MAG: hypothetical protein B6241_12010 [Spirochaetaceae bacterium 4572_59]|nr:MAG: hypothetical protein B6241_12010 [Spirochaetaceae bacterium 4572_59]